MTIESILERIATSCERQERLLEQLLRVTEEYPDLFTKEEATPEPAVPAPVAVAPAPEPPPAVPTFNPPPPPPAPAPDTGCPITDHAGLMKYVMAKYKALGPIKGGQIQNALMQLGATNINGLKPEQYAAFYAAVEALS